MIPNQTLAAYRVLCIHRMRNSDFKNRMKGYILQNIHSKSLESFMRRSEHPIHTYSCGSETVTMDAGTKICRPHSDGWVQI